MRENKFKVWCKDRNEWERDLCAMSQNGEILHLVGMKYRTIASRICPDKHIPIFYTGYRDKNNVEIYDGNILEHPDGMRFQIIWDDEYIGFRAKYNDNNSDITSSIPLQIGEKGLAIVIGHNLENPELLK